jgi:hypothetical protein
VTQSLAQQNVLQIAKQPGDTNEEVYAVVGNPPVGIGEVNEGLVVVGVDRSTDENKPSLNRCGESIEK